MMNETLAGALPAPLSAATVRRPSRYLYVGVASTLAVIVILAFTRTYWAPIASGAIALHPAVHVHAVLFFLWTLFFLTQTVLPLRNRVALHRQLGLFGIALAAMMVFAGVLATIVSLKAGLGVRPVIARTSAALSFGGMTLFSTFIVFGIANVLNSERHKRFMLLATFSILQSAVARWIMLIPAIGLPVRILIGAVFVDLLLLAVIVIDSRARGRVHPVFVYGGALIVFVQWARIAMLDTAAWIAFTHWLAAL